MNKLTKLLAVSFAGIIAFSNTCWTRPIDRALERTVMIIVFDGQSQPIGIGSGFIVSEDGQIATNYHVLEGGHSALVKFQGTERPFPVLSISHKSVEHDLAVVKVSKRSEALKLSDDSLVQIGDSIHAVGNPEGLEGTLSEGIVSGFRKVDETTRLMQITAPISPGSSGGPVINKEGSVIGIATASYVTGQNLNFAIPASVLRELMKKPNANENFPLDAAPHGVNALAGSNKPNDLVSVFSVKRAHYVNDSGIATFSIRNDTRRDITNLRLLFIWKDKDGNPLHYSPIIVKDVIPSKLTKRIEKIGLDGVGTLYSYHATLSQKQVEVRVLDYKILESSGLLEFQ